jgi:two-component system response regulator BaeR
MAALAETAKRSMVLIAEHERATADLLVEKLESAGFDARLVPDKSGITQTARSLRPDLILLDVMPPRHDVLSLCRELRDFTDVPIVIVMPRNDEIDRLIAFELGADDCICRPFGAREIVARIKAILKRTQPSRRVPAEARLVINVEEYQVALDDQALDLTPVEFRLLATLGSKPGRVFSRESLLDKLYADNRIVNDRAIDTHIKNLKRKLRMVRPDQEIIHSIYGVGYRLELRTAARERVARLG